MRDCTACGRTIDEGDAFCRACGAATGVASSPPSSDRDAPPSPPGSSPGGRWWLVPTVVAVAAVLSVLLGLVVSFGASADDFVGVWTTFGGGESTISLTVTEADGELEASLPGFGFEGEDVAAQASIEGDALVFEYAADPESDTSPSLDCEAVLESPDRMRLTVVGIEQGTDITVAMTLRRATTGSPVTPSSSAEEAAMDAAVKEGIHSIQVGIQSWAVDHKDTYPTPETVAPDGKMATYLDKWPTNTFTGEPMRPGAGPGDYTYTVPPDRESFVLSGHLAGGGDFTVP